MIKVILMIVGLFSYQYSFGGEMYRLLEDPKKGPSFLKTWEVPEPLKKEQWTKIVGARSTVPYAVKPGDTLSKICREILGDQNYWPKLWEVNKDTITNPHVIEPNQTINFNIPEGLERLVASEKLVMAPNLASSRLESKDELNRDDFKDYSFRSLFLPEDEESLGIVTGSYQDSTKLTAGSRIYVGVFDKSKVPTGKTFSVVREVQLRNKNLIQVVGRIQIDAYGDDLARATVMGAYRGVERGDRIMDLPLLDMKAPTLLPPPSVSARILMGDNPDRETFSSGDLVLLDRGIEEGLQTGQLFRVFDDLDPVFNSSQLIEPRSKAEVKIVHAGRKSSTGYIQNCDAPVHLGDTLLPSDKLPSHRASAEGQRKAAVVE